MSDYPKISLGCTVPASNDNFTIAIRFENNSTNVPFIMRTIGEDAETACLAAQNNTSFARYGTPCANYNDVMNFIKNSILIDPNVVMTSSLDTFLEKVKFYYESI